jgi:hypothetical protein
MLVQLGSASHIYEKDIDIKSPIGTSGLLSVVSKVGGGSYSLYDGSKTCIKASLNANEKGFL